MYDRSLSGRRATAVFSLTGKTHWATAFVTMVCLGMANGALAQIVAPDDPSLVNNLMLWLRVDVGVEASPGVPATPGGPVGIWQDSSPNGFAVELVTDV